MDNSQQVHIYGKDDLANIITHSLAKLLENIKESKKPIKLLNRKQTAEFFGVSAPTIDEWSRKGIIISYRTGSRRYFKLNELEEALTKINE